MEEDLSSDIEGGKTAAEYLSMLRRYRAQIIAVTVVLAAITLFTAITLPPIYRSTATILVQEQEVPPELVRSTITSFADERIQVISQQVMTRTVLLQLVDKYDLYEKYRGRVTDEDILERMRKDIRISTVNADISDRSSGRRVNATIAFTISYDAPQPDQAQMVVSELVSLYLNENVKVRQQSVAETTAFLASEADRLAKQIQSIETKLADFKRRNVGRLPDSSAVNVQLSDRNGAELQRVEREISLNQDRKLTLEAQLAQLRSNAPAIGAAGERVSSPEERLRALRAQYASLSAVYGADHPDVRRVKREIAALEAGTGAQGNAETTDQIRKLESELAAAKERYGDDHPDVQRLNRSLAALKAADAKAPVTKASGKGLGVDSIQPTDNPAYVVLATQLDSTKRELSQLVTQRDDLQAKQRTYDARLLQIPEVEREYSELTRDYGNSQTRYREIKAKQMQAEGAMELEKDSKAERFSLGEPANLPHAPFSPNRPMIVVAGLVASLGGGLGLAFLRDGLDSSVKGPAELGRLARVPILTAIPYISTERDRTVGHRRIAALTSMYFLLGLFLLLTVHFFAKPLPALFQSAMRKLGFF